MTDRKVAIDQDEPLTVGGLRVGIDSNPSGLRSVQSIKVLAASLIDAILAIDAGGYSGDIARLKDIAALEVESASMWAVKAAVKSKEQNA